MMDRSAQDFTTYPGFAVQQEVNIAGDVARKGFDLGLEYILTDKILFGLNFGYLHSKNRANPAYHFTLPPCNGSFYANVHVNDWISFVPALDFYDSSWYASSGDSRNYRNPGAGIVDLKMTITPPMQKPVSINIGTENLFNKDYRGWNEKYPSPGRYVYANLRYAL
jgi:iron complex outermembrane recepter protein